MSSGKILVVDDDRNLIEVLKVRVESAGYEVTATLKEEAAIAATKEQVFDLAVIDLQLDDLAVEFRTGLVQRQQRLVGDLRALQQIGQPASLGQ